MSSSVQPLGGLRWHYPLRLGPALLLLMALVGLAALGSAEEADAQAQSVQASHWTYSGVPRCTKTTSTEGLIQYGGIHYGIQSAKAETFMSVQGLSIFCLWIHSNVPPNFLRVAGLLYTSSAWCRLDPYVYNGSSTADLIAGGHFTFQPGSVPNPPCGDATYYYNAVGEHWNGAWLGGVVTSPPFVYN